MEGSTAVTQHNIGLAYLLHNVAKRWENTETQLRQEVFACILPYLKGCFKVHLSYSILRHSQLYCTNKSP